jgi:hypothetical protein
MRLFKTQPLMQSMDIAAFEHFSPDGIGFVLGFRDCNSEANSKCTNATFETRERLAGETFSMNYLKSAVISHMERGDFQNPT